MHENKFKVYMLTGTPISNSIAEMFVMQTYIQPEILEKMKIDLFDNWQRAFAEISNNEELDVSGLNYKIVKRLCNFRNVPELMNIYRLNTDIITNEDVKRMSNDIPIVPNIKPNSKGLRTSELIVSSRSMQQEMYMGIEDKSGQYNFGSIIYRLEHFSENPKENLAIKCLSDAKKAALDFRLINPNAGDFEDSRVNNLVKRVLQIYKDNDFRKGTQLVFCDLGVSKQKSQKINLNENMEQEDIDIMQVAKEKGLVLQEDEYGNQFFAKFKSNGEILKRIEINELQDSLFDKFNVYADILKKLVLSGIPQNQIAFIGDTETAKQKQSLFEKVNEGEIRILIGSTAKMGAGTNVQKRLVALHHLDCPWRPSDFEQREGRIIRQGNIFFEADNNFEVEIYKYITEGTCDAKLYQTIEQKLKALEKIKKENIGKEDRILKSIDEEIINVAEIKAIATGNPLIEEKQKIVNMLKKRRTNA